MEKKIEELVDIRDVVIRKDLPKEERMADFLRQIKNPYCFRYQDMVVQLSFSEMEKTMETVFLDYFKTIEH